MVPNDKDMEDMEYCLNTLRGGAHAALRPRDG